MKGKRRIISFDIGIKNMAYCAFDIENDQWRVSAWKIIDLDSDGIHEIAQTIIKRFDEEFHGEFRKEIHDEFRNICILIENQPCLKAPKMKSIQMIVYTYFLMKGCGTILFKSACNKLRVSKSEKSIKKLNYNERKEKSIELAYQYFDINNMSQEHQNFFTCSLKKDDLSDCFLQGVHYIEALFRKKRAKNNRGF